MVSKRSGKKKFLASFSIIVLAAGYGAWALTQPLLSIQPTAVFAPTVLKSTPPALAWPDYGQSAVGIPGYGILTTHGDQQPVPTASIAKVMTALAVLRQRPLNVGEQGPDIVLTQDDIDSYYSFIAKDGSVVGVALGEHISEYQALQALLLPSANNMAVTLARWAFGSVDTYNAYANSYAKQLGLSSMHITDPSGYDLKTVASAEDLTKLGMLAMLNPVFAEIVAQPSAKIPIQGTINNYNFMLGQGGNIGIKTGNNDGDNGAFLFASKQKVNNQELMVVGTIMDGPDLATVLKDSEPLTLSTTHSLQTTTFVKAGQKVGNYTIPGQGSVDAIASEDLSFMTWSGAAYTSSATLKPLTGTVPSGTNVGTITVTNTATKVTNTVPVKLASLAKEPSIVWRLSHPLGN